MKHEMISKIIRTTALTVLPGAALSLFICTLLLGNLLFVMLLPFWLFLAFAVVYFVLDCFPKTSYSRWIKPVIIALLAVITSILLINFVH